MEKEVSSLNPLPPEDPSNPHPGLVSQVELSFVALNLGEAKSSELQEIINSSGKPFTRNSLRGGQIKVKVKTYSNDKSVPEGEGEHVEEEGSEHEFEQLKAPATRKSMSSQQVQELPVTDFEEETFPAITPTTPPSTPRRTLDDNAFSLSKELLQVPATDTEGKSAYPEEEEGISTSEPSEAETAMKMENIHHTLLEKECIVPEVIIVWEYVSKFVIQKMLEGFAVRIPGLGTFTSSILPNDIAQQPNQAKFSLRKTRKFPVFKICPHLKEMYKLMEENYLNQCNVPIIPLNIAVVASNAKLTPGIVEGIIIETLQSFVTGIITNKNLEFPFPYIGKLYIKSKKVYVTFYQQFCEALSFEFAYAPSYITSVLPGSMTPLAYHRPDHQFNSVFHFCDVRSVEDKIAVKPQPYGKGGLVKDLKGTNHPCEFTKNLFNHSNLLFDCSCCQPSDKKLKAGPDDEGEDDDDVSVPGTPPCGFSKNYNRIKKACCTQHGSFAFRKPDGSTFSPQPLFRSSKTGNPILDRLADDRCLLQQAIGCWMKRKVMQTLGTSTVLKHHDREYFRRLYKDGATSGRVNRRSFLVREPEVAPAPGPTRNSNSPASSQGKSDSPKGSFLRRMSVSPPQEEKEEEEEEEEEEENEAAEETEDGGKMEEDEVLTPSMTTFNVKTIRSKSLRKSKEIPENLPQVLGEMGQAETKRSDQASASDL